MYLKSKVKIGFNHLRIMCELSEVETIWGCPVFPMMPTCYEYRKMKRYSWVSLGERVGYSFLGTRAKVLGQTVRISQPVLLEFGLFLFYGIILFFILEFLKLLHIYLSLLSLITTWKRVGERWALKKYICWNVNNAPSSFVPKKLGESLSVFIFF